MTNASFADELRAAADRIGKTPPAELQSLLRRAALRLGNTSGIAFEPEIEDLLSTLGAELKCSRGDLLRSIVREWLETNAYLPVHMLDEDGETDGKA